MVQEGIKIKGCFRVRLGEDGPDGVPVVVGDSGWMDNMIVNLGVQDYILDWLCEGTDGAGKRLDTIMIGTGGEVASDATLIAGSTVHSLIPAGTSIVASRTFQITNDWTSAEHPGGTPAVSNAALLDGTDAQTMFCGNTFASSSWNSNQGLSITYQVQFPTG